MQLPIDEGSPPKRLRTVEQITSAIVQPGVADGDSVTLGTVVTDPVTEAVGAVVIDDAVGGDVRGTVADAVGDEVGAGEVPPGVGAIVATGAEEGDEVGASVRPNDEAVGASVASVAFDSVTFSKLNSKQ
jgi:hypothetical protein